MNTPPKRQPKPVRCERCGKPPCIINRIKLGGWAIFGCTISIIERKTKRSAILAWNRAMQRKGSK